jgi:ABC-2 type transport system permease protein
MPIFDQGYQHWRGKLSSHAWRWWTITRHGVRTQLKSRWTRLVVLFALVPALVLAAFLCIWGLLEQKSNQSLLEMLPFLPEAVRGAPRQFRVPVWTLAYLYFFQVEMFFTMILVVLIGPSLISQDLRFNALPLYFSRPLRRSDYFIGKLGVIGVYLAAVAIVPAVLAYALGVCFSLDLGVVKDTFRILMASVGYGLVVVLSAGTLMLALSSLSRSSLYVGAAWVGIWLVSNALGGILTETVRADWCPLTSYTTNLDRVCQVLLDSDSAQKQILASAPGSFGGDRRGGRPTPPAPPLDGQVRRPAPVPKWYWSATVLAGLFGLSVWILTSRVKSLDRLR